MSRYCGVKVYTTWVHGPEGKTPQDQMEKQIVNKADKDDDMLMLQLLKRPITQNSRYQPDEVNVLT